MPLAARNRLPVPDTCFTRSSAAALSRAPVNRGIAASARHCGLIVAVELKHSSDCTATTIGPVTARS
eukprot:1727-Heterococcus_DN1.PRE.1